MSDEPQASPEPPSEDPHPWRKATPPPRARGNSIVLGLVVGAAFLWAVVLLGPLIPVVGGAIALIVPCAYLVAAILLSVGRRAARLATGLFVGLGVFLLTGAGVCISLVNSGRIVL